MMKDMKIQDLMSSATGNFFLLAGPCVIEGEDMAMEIAEKVTGITKALNIPYVFKALIVDDIDVLGESIICMDGKN